MSEHDMHDPARLADLLSLSVLSERIDHGASRLAEARLGAVAVPRDALKSSLLEHLALRHAAADLVLRRRWRYVSDALQAGATLAEVAAACGLDVDEVVVGTRSWLDVQLDNEWMSAVEYGQRMTSLGGGAR